MQQVLCPVLVGRDEEARQLRAALAAAEAGRGGAVFLTGEAGIGKSRLVRETVRAAGERGLTVLAGRAVAGGVPTPFRPFAEALTSAGRAGRLPASEELDPFRPVLGRLVPEWRPAQGTPGEESPVFLGEAVLRLLRVLSPRAGCVLVLEDLHWADQETLALLEYLADNLAAERVLCLGTLRAESPGGRARRPPWSARWQRADPPPCSRSAAWTRRRWPTWPGPAWTPPTCRTRYTPSSPSGPRASRSWSRRSWPAWCGRGR